MKWRINFYDTSTMPTREMREAMLNADVGDDVYQDDPSVNQLEIEAADIIGKEAALFMPSGTMGNLVALMSQCQRGDEVILEEESHIYYYEVGGVSAVAGLVPMLVKGNYGVLEPEVVMNRLRKPDIHYPRTSLLCIENTHNRAGGTITPPARMKELRDLANDHGLRVHLDGARIFNAAVALRVPVTEFTQYVDTVMFCLSKGLGAPVGSILASDKHTISTARHLRKMLGGGMRRSGFLAAAGLIALRTGINQLEIDHLNACKLAALLSDIPFIKVDCEHVQTNMVMVDVEPSGMTAEEVGDLLKERGIKVSVRPPYLLRLVTHKDITTKMIDEAVSEVKDLFRNIR